MKKLRWDTPRPVPRHPYRDTAIFYAILAGIVIGVTALTSGDLRRSLVLAGALFFGATAYSWWRWQQRIRNQPEEE